MLVPNNGYECGCMPEIETWHPQWTAPGAPCDVYATYPTGRAGAGAPTGLICAVFDKPNKVFWHGVYREADSVCVTGTQKNACGAKVHASKFKLLCSLPPGGQR